MSRAERGESFLSDLGFAHIEAPQPGQSGQSRERFVADGGIREIQARQVAERLEVRRGGIVDPLDVPETQTPQVSQMRERLQAVRSNRGAAQIEMLELLELRKPGQPEIGNTHA